MLSLRYVAIARRHLTVLPLDAACAQRNPIGFPLHLQREIGIDSSIELNSQRRSPLPARTSFP
jgi:hypothetical protein